ncbi:MAG: AlpA family phage regulatory protein [Rubrivivax sp.]
MTTVTSKASAYASAAPSVPTLPQTGFIRQAQVLAFIPFSKSTLWRQVAAGVFPAPVKLTPSITAWRAEDIRTWIESRSVAA